MKASPAISALALAAISTMAAIACLPRETELGRQLLLPDGGYAPIGSDAGVAPSREWKPPAGEITGTAWYVSPSGDDANPGTLTQPFRSIERGVLAAGPGETVVLRAGVYPGDLRLRYDPDLRAVASGQPGRPITLRNFPGERATLGTPGETNPTLEGIWVGGWAPQTLDYWRIEGLEITGVLMGIRIFGSHNEIVGNYVHDVPGTGISTWEDPAFTGTIVRDNFVERFGVVGIGLAGTDFVAEGNDVSYPVSYGSAALSDELNFLVFRDSGTIRNNVLHHSTPGTTARCEVFQSAGANGVVIERNLVHDTTAASLFGLFPFVADVQNVSIRNNAFWNAEAMGELRPIATPYRVHGVQLVNNTFANTGAELSIRKSADPGGAGAYDITIKNNVFFQTPGYLFDADSLQGKDADYNLVYPANANLSEPHGKNGADPLLRDPAAGDLRLQAGSPAIDSGTSAGAPASDLDGNSRHDDPGSANTSNPDSTPSFVDVGAYEWRP